MADADFSGVLNPKRVHDRRAQEAGDAASAPVKTASGAMSQADFSYGRKKADDPKKQQKLIDALRKRDADFKSSGY